MTKGLHPIKATREVGRSFIYAFAGLIYTMHSQRNMRFHIIFAIFAMVFFVAFDIPFLERAILMIVICLVPAFEIINTSIESQMDYISQDQHILVKRAKDTAAAAVLVVALLSLAMAGYILLPQFIEYFRNRATTPLALTGTRVLLACLVFGSLVFFWIVRSLRYLFKPTLAISSFGVSMGTMALCLSGRDPSAYVAIMFLSALELNAFARMEYKLRITKEWEKGNLPFDTAGFKIIIPFMFAGTVTGYYIYANIVSCIGQ